MSQSKKIKILVVMGTRPEIIKLASVIHLADLRDDFDIDVCHTGQHYDLAEPILDYFHIEPNFRLNLMQDRPTLTKLVSSCLADLETVLNNGAYDAIVCQGDTATCASAALAGFLCRVPVVHVEAGLRTGDINSPWPEEFNRRLAGLAASLHCAATDIAFDNLRREGIPNDLIVKTGNTVIDALQWAIEKEKDAEYDEIDGRPIVLLTAHRRENFGEPLRQICLAVSRLADEFSDHRFIFVTHPNPNAGPVVRSLLEGRDNIELRDPLTYQEFVRLACQAKLIISDSGGVQEESPTLGVPLLITRESTERPEAVNAGAARLVGTDEENVYANARELLSDVEAHAAMTHIENPFGDGNAAEKILNAIANFVSDKNSTANHSASAVVRQ